MDFLRGNFLIIRHHHHRVDLHLDGSADINVSESKELSERNQIPNDKRGA